MSAPAPPGFIEAIQALRAGLQELGVPWVVIGGVAVIARGVPRFTADVDTTAAAVSPLCCASPGALPGTLGDVFARMRSVGFFLPAVVQQDLLRRAGETA